MSKHNKQNREERQPDNSVQEGEFFTRLDEPILFRRNILEASKASLNVIKGLYIIREIKVKKQEKLSSLQHEVREIRLLMQKAEELLPKHSKQEALRLFPHVTEKLEKKQAKLEEVKTAKPVTPVQSSSQKQLSDLDRLSHSINTIDAKIKNMPHRKEQPPQLVKKNEPIKVEQPIPVEKVVSPPKDNLTAELEKTLDSIQKRLKQL